MTSPKDPKDLLTAYTPAILELADGEEQFVAHRRYIDGGWIHTIEWDGSARDWSPVAVESVEPVETETVVSDSGAGTQAIVDDELCDRARWLAGIAEVPK
jgi:hypothetical protein